MTYQPQTAAREQVRGLLREIDQRDADLEREIAEIDRQIATVEASIGTAYLSGDATAGDELPALRAHREKAAAARVELSKVRAARQRDRLIAETVDLQRSIDTWQAEFAALEAACAPLLQQLSTLEGVEYDECILHAQRIGDWQPASVSLQCRPTQRDLLTVSPREVSPDVGAVYLAPRRRLLRNAIRDARRKIEAIQAQLSPPGDAPRPVPVASVPAPEPRAPQVEVIHPGNIDEFVRREMAIDAERGRVARGVAAAAEESRQ